MNISVKMNLAFPLYQSLQKNQIKLKHTIKTGRSKPSSLQIIEVLFFIFLDCMIFQFGPKKNNKKNLTLPYESPHKERSDFFSYF